MAHIRRNLLIISVRGLGVVDVCIYAILILRDQLVVRSLELICPVATSGYNYLAQLGDWA